MKVKSKFWLITVLMLLSLTRSYGQTTHLRGLVVIVNFNDYQLNATTSQINSMINSTSGFNLWGNTTSVREYFRAQTNNKIDLTNEIITIHLNQNSTYYISDNAPGDLVSDIITAIDAQFPNGFTNLTTHPTQNKLSNFSIICQSQHGRGVAWRIEKYITNNGSPMRISNVSLCAWTSDNSYDVKVVCHEYGHSVWNWTDYYRTAFCNLGRFDLMSSGGSEKGPMPLNPALRIQQGWIDNIINVSGTQTATYTLTANSYSTIHKYSNPYNPKEYLLFHAVKHGGHYLPVSNGQPVPEGLMIWYVDEDMGYGLSGLDDQYTVKLVQADNKDEMHDENASSINIGGDMNDLYGNGNNSFPNGHPWRWKDGGEFGITLTNINRSGNNVSFTVQGRPCTIIATSDENGTIYPSGVIRTDDNSDPVFTFRPKPGYEINTVRIDGNQVQVNSNQHRLTNVSGQKSIAVTYKRKTSQTLLPLPWQKADIGNASTSGFSSYENGKFYLESYGNDVYDNNDKFHFVYQVLDGNGYIEGRLDHANKPKAWAKTGLMIRSSLQDNAAHAMLIYTTSNNTRVQYREVNGGGSSDGPHNLAPDLHWYELYKWFRIVRQGNTITSYISRDKVTWLQYSEKNIAMPQQVYVGMIVTGANGNYPIRASFDNITVISNSTSSPCLNGIKISGTSIGSEGSWNNDGNTRDKAFDGNTNTYFDAPSGQAWTGLQTEAPHTVSSIRYFPRQDAANRMVGGKFQGSNTADFSSGVADLAIITQQPSYSWQCISITNPNSFRYFRYICPPNGYGNVAEVEFYGTSNPDCTPVGALLSGTSIGSEGSFQNGGNTRDKAFDGNTNTYFDGTSDLVWTGLTLSSESVINTIRFIPRNSYTNRMTGGKFQGSNTADFSSGVTDLAVISKEPVAGWNCISVSHPTAFKYVRYICPPNGYGNVAEIQFYGTHSQSNVPSIRITSPQHYAIVPINTPINFSTFTFAPAGPIVKVEFYQGSTLLGTGIAPYRPGIYPTNFSYTWNNAPAGIHTITAVTYNQQGVTASHNIIVQVTNLSGPSCATNNAQLTYELGASARNGAIGFAWYFTGTSQSIQSIPSTPYRAVLHSGSNFSEGNVCAVAVFNMGHTYIHHCKRVIQCSNNRVSDTEVIDLYGAETISYQNPFSTTTTISFGNPAETADIQVFNSAGMLMEEANATGTFQFGEKVGPGLYLLRINFYDRSEVIKLIKQ